MIQVYFQKGLSFNNINSLQRDTVSYWFNFVQKCCNWRWWAAILDLIEAHKRVRYSILKTIFTNSSVQNLKKEKKKKKKKKKQSRRKVQRHEQNWDNINK